MSAKIPTLDLHGFTEDEALAALDQFLMKNSQGPAPSIRVMTGKGKGVLQKAVAQYLRTAGYPSKLETLPNGQKNEGVLIVFMN